VSTDDYRAHLVRRMLDSGVPHHVHEGLREYIAARRPVGGFLTAVLSNDLLEACVRADEINQRCLTAIVHFLHAYAPAPCWGSPEKVTAWLTDPDPPPEVYE
jgi:hypothetical protein